MARRRRYGRRFKRRRIRRRYGRRRFGRRFRSRRTRPETKFIDYDLAVAPFNNISSTSWSELSIPNQIAQGLDREDRLGREITIKSIWIRGIIATGNQPFDEIGPSNDYTFVRVVLASWNGTAGLTPLTTLGYFFTTLIKPSVTQDLRKKFYDRTFIFQNAQLHATLNGYQKQFKKFRIYRRFRKGYRVKWILPNTATSVKRQITLSCISSVVDVTGEPHITIGQLGVKYYDN